MLKIVHNEVRKLAFLPLSPPENADLLSTCTLFQSLFLHYIRVRRRPQ